MDLFRRMNEKIGNIVVPWDYLRYSKVLYSTVEYCTVVCGIVAGARVKLAFMIWVRDRVCTQSGYLYCMIDASTLLMTALKCLIDPSKDLYVSFIRRVKCAAIITLLL